MNSPRNAAARLRAAVDSRENRARCEQTDSYVAYPETLRLLHDLCQRNMIHLGGVTLQLTSPLAR